MAGRRTISTSLVSEASRPRILVVGGGFAGFHAARRLERTFARRPVDLILVSSTDYLLYSPLLPEVATGTLDPRHVAISLRQALPRVRTVLGYVTGIDLEGQTATIVHDRRMKPEEPRLTESGERGIGVTAMHWDRLVLTPGSVTRQFDIPGVAEHAHGFKTLTEAIYLRDHVLSQIDLADSAPDTPAGHIERQQRLTVVAVGAGYTGTEFVAQMQHWLTTVSNRWVRTGAQDVRWVLVDLAPAVLPELGARLGQSALRTLTKRGVEVRLGVTVASADDTSVTLTDGDVVATRTLVWGAGVAPSPLIATLGLPVDRGRLIVDEFLQVPGWGHVWCGGDAAAVPDLSKPPPGQAADKPDAKPTARPITPPTAQHAQRQGKALARNVAASFEVGQRRPYRHSDLGLVADLGGASAVAKPFGLPFTGLLAKLMARCYHLYTVPTLAAKVRVGVDWMMAAVLSTQVVQLSAIPETDALISAAQKLYVYPAPSTNPPPVEQRPTTSSHPATDSPVPT